MVLKQVPPVEAKRGLDRKSAVPLYHQLFIELRRRLLEGEWKPGEPFPKDSDIEEAYGVSRITVRQALAQLVDANFVVRYRGRGSFVGNLPREGAQVNHRTVADEIRSSGRAPSHRNLAVERHPVSDMTARQFDLAVGDEVAILKRLHFADGVPICHEAVMLSTRRYPGVFDRVMEDRETLLEAYGRLGIEVAKADQTVSAVMPSDERRVLLDLPENIPAILVDRVGYSAANEPLEVRRLFYRSDVFNLRQEIIWGPAEARIVPSAQTG